MSREADRALCKALLLRESLRAAAHAQVSAQAQALLATIIAEAWPDRDTPWWTSRASMRLLEQRLGCSRDSIRRWTAELRTARLIRRQVGAPGRISRWFVIYDVERAAAARDERERARAHRCAERTHAPSEGAPVRPERAHQCAPDSDLRKIQDAAGVVVPEGTTPASIHQHALAKPRPVVPALTPEEQAQRVEKIRRAVAAHRSDAPT